MLTIRPTCQVAAVETEKEKAEEAAVAAVSFGVEGKPRVPDESIAVTVTKKEYATAPIGAVNARGEQQVRHAHGVARVGRPVSFFCRALNTRPE